jgi:hypothetical protein
VKTTFHFKNTGDHPVTITGTRPSCGCTTAALDKKTYAPGESGVIAVVFHSADRIGLQEKYITVTTDELNQTPTQLLFEVNIRQYLTAEPLYLAWKIGEKPSERMIVVSALPSHPIIDLTAQGESPGFCETRIEVVEKGRKYNVYVKPVSTEKILNTAVFIDARFAGNTGRRTEAFIKVNPVGMSQTDD